MTSSLRRGTKRILLRDPLYKAAFDAGAELLEFSSKVIRMSFPKTLEAEAAARALGDRIEACSLDGFVGRGAGDGLEAGTNAYLSRLATRGLMGCGRGIDRMVAADSMIDEVFEEVREEIRREKSEVVRVRMFEQEEDEMNAVGMNGAGHQPHQVRVKVVLVVSDAAYARRNKLEEKLQARGVDVARHVDINVSDMPALDKSIVDALVFQCATAGHKDEVRWRSHAEKQGIAYFPLQHQVSHQSWENLQSFVAKRRSEARGLLVPGGEPEPAPSTGQRDAYWRNRAEVAELEASQLRVDNKRLEAEVATAVHAERARAGEKSHLERELREAREAVGRSEGEQRELERSCEIAEEQARRTSQAAVEAQAQSLAKLQGLEDKLAQRDRALASSQEALRQAQEKLHAFAGLESSAADGAKMVQELLARATRAEAQHLEASSKLGEAEKEIRRLQATVADECVEMGLVETLRKENRKLREENTWLASGGTVSPLLPTLEKLAGLVMEDLLTPEEAWGKLLKKAGLAAKVAS